MNLFNLLPHFSGRKIVLGEFRIANRQFSEALTSWTSNEFQMLASEVIKSVRNCTKQNYKHNIIIKVIILLLKL